MQLMEADLKRTVSALDARRRLGEMLEGVYYRGDEVIIERAGKPMAVVIPAERYEALERSRERLFDFIEQAQDRSRAVPEGELAAEIERAIREVRVPSSSDR
jgi:prevent-host-death family protein